MVGKNRKSGGLFTPNSKQMQTPESQKKFLSTDDVGEKAKQLSNKKMKGLDNSMRTPNLKNAKGIHVSFQLPNKNLSASPSKTKHPPTPMPKKKELSVMARNKGKGNMEFRGMNESLSKLKQQVGNFKASNKGGSSPMKKLLDKLNAESDDSDEDEDDDDDDLEDDEDDDDLDSEEEQKIRKKLIALKQKEAVEKKTGSQKQGQEESSDDDDDEDDDEDDDDFDSEDEKEGEEIRKKLIALKQKQTPEEKALSQKQNKTPNKTQKESFGSVKKTKQEDKSRSPLKESGKGKISEDDDDDDLDSDDDDDDDLDSDEEEEIRKKILAIKQKKTPEKKALVQKQNETPKQSVAKSGAVDQTPVSAKKKSMLEAKSQSLVKTSGKRKAESSDDEEEDEDDDDEEDESDSSDSPSQHQILQQVKAASKQDKSVTKSKAIGKNAEAKTPNKANTDKSSALNQSLSESAKKTLKGMKQEKGTPAKEKDKNLSPGILKDKEIRKQKDARTLFVRGLPADVTVEELKSLSPDILDVNFPKRKFYRNKVHKVFAFLEFASEKKAEENFPILQNKKLRGQPLFVDYSGEKSLTSKATEASQKPKTYNKLKLFVSGLPEDANIAEVAALFPKAIIINLNKSRTANVLFATEEDAENALKANEKSKIHGKLITVLYSLQSSEDIKKKRSRRRKSKQQENVQTPPAKKMKIDPKPQQQEQDSDDDDDDDDESDD